jgi:uncharacterized membrane protein YccC
MVPALSNAPELLVLALALWTGLCLYLSLQDRSASGYVFMLAGYTAAFIGFPSVDMPQNVFDSAISRVEEIGLGILCASVVHSLVLPAGMAPSVMGLVDRTLGDAGRWFRDLLKPGRTDAPTQRQVMQDRQRLAVDLTALRLLSIHVPFDTGRLRWAAGAVGAMQDGVAALTPLLSAVEDRLQGLLEAEGAIASDVEAVLARVADWLASEQPAGAELLALRESMHRLGRTAEPVAPWNRALRIALAVRLEELIDGWQRCDGLRRGIDGFLAGTAPLPRTDGVIGNRVLHRDRGMALLSAFAAVLAVCLCGAFWIATAWPSGSAAAMMAAVFCSFFATMDDPAPGIYSFLKFTVLSLPISAVYVLLLPNVQDFGQLVLLCAPVMLLLGCLMARPSTGMPSLIIAFGVLGTLSLHDTASVNMPAFLNSNLAQIVGIAAAALVTRLVRTVGAEWSARRIRRAIWREIGALAAAPRAQARHDAYAVRMVDRISLIAPRLAQVEAAVRDASADATLRDLRTGADIVALQRARPDLPADTGAALLRAVSGWFRGRRNEDPTPARPGVQAELERLLASLLDSAAEPSAPQRAAVAALVGLRRNLFPDAPPRLAAANLVPQLQP